MGTPDIHEKRHALLLAMKTAPDYYELAFSSAEHSGYLKGLQASGVISEAAQQIYMAESESVATAAGNRLAAELERVA